MKNGFAFRMWLVFLISSVLPALAAPPVVNWFRPTNGATFLAGSTITLMATASDADGTINFVEFFAAGTNSSMLLGRVSALNTNLYTFRWSNAPAGPFQLHAEAVDNAGERGISGSVQIFIQPGTNQPPTPPTITSQPQSQTVNEGATVTFSVTATGTQPLSYRWRKNGVT